MVEGDSVLDTVELTLDPGLLTTNPTEGKLLFLNLSILVSCLAAKNT